MNTTKLISFGGMMVFGALVTVSGCNGMEPGGGDGENGVTASVKMAFSGGDWSYNSVRIVADRDGDADGKYPCVNDVTGCFNFNADGIAIPYDNGAKKFDELCPVENVNKYGDNGSGLYTFTYNIFNAPNCQGDLINDPNADTNFECYDISDLDDRYYPNQSVDEALHAGDVVENVIMCLSANVEKTFDFNTCVLEDEDEMTGSIELDCACYPHNGSCKCPFATDGLADGCYVGASPDCNIICN